ncbi:uL15 family ribosomal protein [Candidatus Pacearchaeota archaeon]|nr:uL15 family ribosomal protein [Candidatus Pacearchaeota archaeon]
MKTHKRKKNSRIRGARTVGWGFRQKHKGHGNKGGFGMAGTGKKADHKKQAARDSDEKGKYFGKQGATSRGTKRIKYEKINLKDIKDNFFKKVGDKINFSKHKILGNGEGFNAEIKALNATTSAIEKMEKAGGKIVLVKKIEKDVKQYSKKEVKSEKVKDKKE